MEQLINLLVVVISPEQVLRRHYFLEILNKPEYIWGIRAIGVMTAILTFFLYIKLKEAVNLAEAAAGSVEADVDSTSGIDADSRSSAGVEMPDLTILDLDLEPDTEQVSELSSEPEPDQVLELSPEPEPDQALELSPEPESEQVSELFSEPTPAPDSEHMSTPEPVPVDISITEHTYRRKDEVEPVRKHTVSNVSETIGEKNLLLLALIGISLGGLILYTYGRKRKKGKR